MAVWQYSMHLVPASELMASCQVVNGAVLGDVFDDSTWWASTQPPDDFEARFATVLSEVPSWDPESRQWGESDTTTVQVHYTAGRVDEVWARLDLRVDWTRAFDVLVQLAHDAEAVWVGGEQGKRVLLGRDRPTLLDAVERSSAKEFVQNPRRYLDGLPRRIP